MKSEFIQKLTFVFEGLNLTNWHFITVNRRANFNITTRKVLTTTVFDNTIHFRISSFDTFFRTRHVQIVWHSNRHRWHCLLTSSCISNIKYDCFQRRWGNGWNSLSYLDTPLYRIYWKFLLQRFEDKIWQIGHNTGQFDGWRLKLYQNYRVEAERWKYKFLNMDM